MLCYSHFTDDCNSNQPYNTGSAGHLLLKEGSVPKTIDVWDFVRAQLCQTNFLSHLTLHVKHDAWWCLWGRAPIAYVVVRAPSAVFIHRTWKTLHFEHIRFYFNGLSSGAQNNEHLKRAYTYIKFKIVKLLQRFCRLLLTVCNCYCHLQEPCLVQIYYYYSIKL